VFGQLGWTSWVSPPKVADGDERYFSDARFDLQQRRQAPAEGLARAPTGGEEQ
jgi:hypothetical protein